MLINGIILVLTMVYLYNVGISLFAWKGEKKVEEVGIDKDFIILIPAHNEEEVIEDNLRAILRSNYDLSKLHVYVIADNCTDGTVEVCNNIIQENNEYDCNVIEVSGGNKPAALNKGINHLKLRNLWNDAYVVILDADNMVDENMFKVFSKHHNKYSILQCRIKSQNESTIVSRGFASTFNTMTYGFQIAKNNIGLSASLCGTGFSVKKEVFDSVGFDQCDTLTEDLEFSVLAILQGYKVKFTGETYVLNQNLDEFKPSVTQRVRWCKGHMQVSVKLSWSVIKAFFKKPSLQLFDTFIFINSPSRTVIYSAANILAIAFLMDEGLFFSTIMTVCFFYNFIFILKCNNFRGKYFIAHMLFSIVMYFIIVYSAFTYKDKTWKKTVHRKLQLTD